MNATIQDAESRMTKVIEAFRQELSKIRTGRAHTSLLDHVRVEYYGSEVPISQVANITVLDSRTLGVSPWDKTAAKAVEKAIQNSDLGLNPASMGDLIRVPLPPMTEERRKELAKVVKGEAENSRVAVRNIRRDANQHLKNKVKAKEMTEDDERRGEEKIQQLTNQYIAKIDELMAAKEKELMEI